MAIPPLLLVHGYPLDHTLWDHARSLVSPDIAVIAPDLHGAEDQIIPVDKARQLATECGAEFVQLPGCGHCSPIEDPESVAKSPRSLRPSMLQS